MTNSIHQLQQRPFFLVNSSTYYIGMTKLKEYLLFHKATHHFNKIHTYFFLQYIAIDSYVKMK